MLKHSVNNHQSIMKDYGLYQYYITTSTTTVRSYYRGDKRDDHIELDDTAPLPLFIGIGLALFIGFVILVLICCFCRRRRVPAVVPPDRPVNTTHYQRAPVNDGMCVGVAYPLASVPPMSYPNSNIVYPPPHMGPTLQHNYGVIGSGMTYSPANLNHFPQQSPHFGGVPTYPPNHYITSLPLAPHSTPLQSHSPSHSSQASSSVSGATADPLVPSSSPYIQQQQPQHHNHPHPQQLHQFSHQQQHIPPMSALQHHQHLQQQFLSGRQSPSLHYSQMAYAAMLANEHSRSDTTTTTAPTVTPSQITCPIVSHQSQQLIQSSNYIEEEEEE